jgi:rRNA-processing protein FCF1
VSKQDSSAQEPDPFLINKLYPDPYSVFTWQPDPLDELIQNSVIVLDTSALVLPYTVGSRSLNEISRVYQKLSDEDRVAIPGQVAREFARTRVHKLAEVAQQLEQKRSEIKKVTIGKYPLLENLKEYQDSLELERELGSSIQAYQNSIGRILDAVRGWNRRDPISELYGSIFKESAIVDPSLDDKAILKDARWRRVHKIAPGYKDAGKDDEGTGDVVIWHTILSIGRERQLGTLFVTGEQKPDWWQRSAGQPLYPRDEMVEEYLAARHSKSCHSHVSWTCSVQRQTQWRRFVMKSKAYPHLIKPRGQARCTEATQLWRMMVGSSYSGMLANTER